MATIKPHEDTGVTWQGMNGRGKEATQEKEQPSCRLTPMFKLLIALRDFLDLWDRELALVAYISVSWISAPIKHHLPFTFPPSEIESHVAQASLEFTM